MCGLVGAATIAGGGMVAEIDETNGGLASLVFADDTNRLNWVEGTGTWGVPLFEQCKKSDRRHPPVFFRSDGFERRGDAFVSRYTLEGCKGAQLLATVTRRAVDGALEETYEFRNEKYGPKYIRRGELGILTPFNDSYHLAPICLTNRCHAHIHALGEASFVHARRMSPGIDDLALTLCAGALDGYSVRRVAQKCSDDRGDFVLHPAAFVLRTGETYRVTWRLARVADGTFAPPVRTRYETCFKGETFEITDRNGVHRVPASKPGEFTAFGARLYVPEDDIDTLIAKCVRHIVRKQQCLDRKSPLYGAYLIYDDEDKAQYFDDDWVDFNASRERMGMGQLVARWLQTHDDAEVRRSFDLYEKFVYREFVDFDTGKVYNTIGKDFRFKRLYNGPHAALFAVECYRLTRERRYLESARNSLLDFYANGGDRFYAAMTVPFIIHELEQAGLDAKDLRRQVRRHVDMMLRNGPNYPPHEVQFEQTIVTPAAGLMAQYYLYIERDPKVLAGLREQIAMLERFDGDQPDHRSGGMPIRHWDGFWFGKRHLYGDTMHYHAGLSASCYFSAYRVLGDPTLLERGRRCFRNLLFLFRGDGWGSAAYYLPLSVTMLNPDGSALAPSERGECFDPFSNDQYTALYNLLRHRDLFAK